MTDSCTRRTSIKTVTLAGVTAGLAGIAANAGVAGNKGNAGAGGTVKVALVGCGGRGKGDLKNFQEACGIIGLRVEVVALADAFKDAVHAAGNSSMCRQQTVLCRIRCLPQGGTVGCGFVLLVTPPLIPPAASRSDAEGRQKRLHREAGRVDAPGCRKVIELGELAKAKGSAFQPARSAATRRATSRTRHSSTPAPSAKSRGVVSGTAPSRGSSDAGTVRAKPTTWPATGSTSPNSPATTSSSSTSTTSTSPSGSSAVPPVSALGFGGRARRETGNQFDFFSVDLDFGDDVHIHSQCRQISGSYSRVGEDVRAAPRASSSAAASSRATSITVPDPKADTENETVAGNVDMIRGVRAASR